MIVRHHPDDALLAAFAAGTLDLGQHVAIATHLTSCPQCRAWTRSMEHIGGTVLASLPPSAMAQDARARVEARLNDTSEVIEPASHASEATAPDLPKTLPAFVRRYRFGDWHWVAPRLSLRPIALPAPSATRVFLLRSDPGMRMLQHSHTGIEMTCVLSGAFSHEGGEFGPGDFDLGDGTVDHRPFVGPGEECVCLVAMQGDLRLNGLLGRLMQPFVRL
jgi:putative transcriptional regulator